MINISAISSRNLLGRILRLLLGVIPNSAVVRVLQGPNGGLRWVKGSGNNSYWLGTYEIEKQQVLRKDLREGMVFYDIGSHVGFFTLLAARCVGESGLVVAFEPFPANIHYLEAHIALNKMKNVVLKKGAVAERGGVLRFATGGSSSGGHISDEGDVVPAYSIDELVAEGMRVPDVAKIDVQGATLLVLRGMKKTLRDNSVKLFIAIDDAPRRGIAPFQKRDIHILLRSLGYHTTDIYGNSIADDRIEDVNEICAVKQTGS